MTLKERATFFSLTEQELIMKSFEEYKNIITTKCNTAAAAKSREEAWKKIADKLNVNNPMGIKWTWQQVKVKYKNIIQSGKCEKRMERQKTGGGPAAPDFTPAEQLALQHNRGRPMMEGIAGGSSSEEAGSSVRRSYVKGKCTSISELSQNS
ncbi:hypothetical protein AOXY_G18419 [Acipenser oxyrinchus oxyrinchus]|uniref:Myb/SANT-like DNA-binding domain-containing protein n=1 Tax=Acipenser oxyrinchus oxyrinchus TaxID=40147 RepID=A0AAD8D205_ACIOX|nr:hypothetical protein AOXY_G18419 [Acipenser oxyrinchus oxyrinchus]